MNGLGEQGPELLRNMLSSTDSGLFTVVVRLHRLQLNSHECLARTTAPTDFLGTQAAGRAPSEVNRPQWS